MKITARVITDAAVAEEVLGTDTRSGTAEGLEVRIVDLATEGLESLLPLVHQRPMFADALLILVKGASGLVKADVAILERAISESESGNRLVFYFSSRSVPKPLLELGAELVETVLTKDADRREYVKASMQRAGVALDVAGLRRVVEVLGDDLGGAASLAEVLALAYPESTVIGSDEVEPYLGTPGDIPLWRLTDEIGQGRVKGAVAAVERMMVNGRAPQQLMAVLERWTLDICTLNSPGLRTVEQAKAALANAGVRGTPDFAIKKELEVSRKLGYSDCSRMVGWLASAARELRGDSVAEPGATIDLLVARLAQLCHR